MSKNVIQEFKLLALLDIVEGASIVELQKTMRMYEAEEHYEACEGIRQAIEYAKYLTIHDIKNFINILKFIDNEQRDN